MNSPAIDQRPAPAFSIEPLSPTLREAMRSTGVWKENGPVPLERLSLVHVSYYDFEGAEHHDGELIMLDAAAKHAATIFRILHLQKFPIAKIRSVHHYHANDEASMADNNTSCFCDRPIEGTTLTSLHSYGLAIDLNPLQNPFILFDEEKGSATFHPPKGWQYLNRQNKKPGMIEDVVNLFAEHGFFIWGGRWTTPVDYHHVQPPRGIAELLMLMPADQGHDFLRLCSNYRQQLSKMPFGENLTELKNLCTESPADFFDVFVEHLPILSA